MISRRVIIIVVREVRERLEVQSSALIQSVQVRHLTANESLPTTYSLTIARLRTALRVSIGVFEVTGARATAAKVGLDRSWRDVRTHSLHDPVAYKEQELGRYVLKDEVPEPTWYT